MSSTTKGKKTRHSDKKYEKATGEVLAVIPNMPVLSASATYQYPVIMPGCAHKLRKDASTSTYCRICT